MSMNRKESELLEKMFAISQYIFTLNNLLQESGKTVGALSKSGKKIWGLLHILHVNGMLTVPQVARKRAVSRQFIQRLANDLEEEGLVEFIDNPGHKRSKLMRMTPAGLKKYQEILAEIEKTFGELAMQFNLEDADTALNVLEEMSRAIAGHLETSK
ncbi:MarR family winged helix-turn-helix transcriptional regulator [Limisalsivibrio acetivorans]|uniref:MarR family winged helix-turn-helix transcriptional regulator n=1 Tax=Limisalsivibrio acetivorans TaxID=1304888 RepID=UPI0003B52D1C|nr:MarR family transcriptional regulator [Limisalsivibrio acetivorans]